MKVKHLNVLVILAAFMLMLFSACSNNTSSAPASTLTPAPASTPASTPAETPESSTDGLLPVFTLEELAQYDGQNGNPAYVAVDGIVYDVTNVPQWAGGEHYNNVTAGQDLTDAIKNESPHGLSVLENLPIVGTMDA